MNQITLFEHQDLERVKSDIGKWVLEYVQRLGVGTKFFAGDLCAYVWSHKRCAPESPGRILRQLRLQGYFDYEVIDRSQALYQVTEVHYGQDNR